MSSLSGKQGPRYRHTAGESEPYETIAVEKLTPIIGAEITGVDIAALVGLNRKIGVAVNREIERISSRLYGSAGRRREGQNCIHEGQRAFRIHTNLPPRYRL